jgi:hypothetical protein
MPIDISPVPLADVLPLRELYRREMNCQIIHDSLPGRGFGDLFLDVASRATLQKAGLLPCARLLSGVLEAG